MKLIERLNEIFLIVGIICVIIASIGYSSAASDDYTDLVKLINDNEDGRMDAKDLAFLLATHGFDASPKGSYAIVKLDKAIYKVMPNGVKPGLAYISILE